LKDSDRSEAINRYRKRVESKSPVRRSSLSLPKFVGGLLLIAGGLSAWLFTLGPLSTRQTQSEWPTVEGEVVESDLVCAPCSDERWNLEVKFRYEVSGSRYRGEQEWYLGQGAGFRRPKWAEEEQAKYVTGLAVPVYYNPVDHSQAVLKPGRVSSSSVEWTVLGFMASFCGLLVIVESFAKSRK
jgi:hypothetical protein